MMPEPIKPGTPIDHGLKRTVQIRGEMDESSTLAYELLRHGGDSALMDYASTHEYPEKNFHLGVAYMQRWEDKTAQYSFERHLRNNSNSIGSLCNLAYLLQDADDYHGAESMIKKAEEKLPTSLKVCFQHAEFLQLWNRSIPAGSDNARVGLLKEKQSRDLLINAIRRLLEESKIDMEWLLNNGKRKESISGAFFTTKVDWGYSFPYLTIEELKYSELLHLIKDWHHLMVFHKDNSYNYSPIGGAACPQRECWLSP